MTRGVDGGGRGGAAHNTFRQLQQVVAAVVGCFVAADVAGVGAVVVAVIVVVVMAVAVAVVVVVVDVATAVVVASHESVTGGGMHRGPPRGSLVVTTTSWGLPVTATIVA